MMKIWLNQIMISSHSNYCYILDWMTCAFNLNTDPFNLISSKLLTRFPLLNPPQSYNSGGSSGGSVSSMSGPAQKRMEDSSARFTNANFQEVSTHAAGGGGKDGTVADVKGAEGKNKKANSHCAPQRGRKSATGKPLGAVVTTATSSTSSCSPFQQSE